MPLHGLCPECDRLLALYQTASVELHLLCAALTQAARSGALDSHAVILEKCNHCLKTCDET